MAKHTMNTHFERTSLILPIIPKSMPDPNYIKGGIVEPNTIVKDDPNPLYTLTFDCPCTGHPSLKPQPIQILISKAPSCSKDGANIWQAIIVRKPTIAAPGLLRINPSAKLKSMHCDFHTQGSWLCEYKDLINA